MSPAVTQIVERVRSRFGVALEVVDAALQPLIPASGGELLRAAQASASSRAALAAAMQAGRPRTVDVAGASFLIQPLRGSRGSRKSVGLLSIRQPAQGAPTAVDDAGSWIDLLRIAVEAELSASEGLGGERLQARRTTGVLRFLAQLSTLTTESELARAVVHAAAVWFDLDARLYRRDLTGEFVLHTHLPGVPDPAPFRTLGALASGPLPGRPFMTAPDAAGLGWAGPEAMLVPVTGEEGAEWMLALGGVIPAEAEFIFHTVADALGSQMAQVSAAARAASRTRFAAIAGQASRAPELTIMDLLRQVMADAGAAAGAVVLFDAGGSRRLAAVGALPPAGTDRDVVRIEPQRVTMPVAVTPDDAATLDLIAAEGTSFSVAAVAAVREAVPLLQVLLAGIVRSEDRRRGGVPAVSGGDSAFVERITQELERAKRFDLGLSMVLIEMNAELDPSTFADLLASVRAELRGSDVLGVVGEARIAALLVHTDGSGVTAVMSRVRGRLQQHRTILPAARLGQAVLSSDCATTTEFLARAAQNAEAA